MRPRTFPWASVSGGQMISPDRRPSVRPSQSMVMCVVLALSACSADAVEPTPSAVASTGATTSAEAASPSAEASAEPDWTALESLEPLVTETIPLTADWPWLSLATAIGEDIWWPNGNEGGPPAVARLNAKTMEVVAVIDLEGEEGVFPPDAWGSAPSQSGGIWVPLAYQNAVVRIDPETNDVAQRIELDATPYAVTEDGDDLWIADWENSEVLRIDIPTGEETMRVAGVTEPTEIVIGEEGLWVNEHSTNEIVRLDPETGEELARVEIGGRPGMTLGDGSVWARSDDEQLVMRIDPATNAVVATIPMPSHPTGLLIAGDAVWVATGPQRGSCERNSYLVRIDPASTQPDGIMEMPCLFGLMSDGTQLWAGRTADEGPEMLRLEVAASP